MFYYEHLLFGPAGGLWEMWFRAIRAERWGVWVTPSLIHHLPLIVGCFRNTNSSTGLFSSRKSKLGRVAGMAVCSLLQKEERDVRGMQVYELVHTHGPPTTRRRHQRTVFSERTSAEINRRANVNPCKDPQLCQLLGGILLVVSPFTQNVPLWKINYKIIYIKYILQARIRRQTHLSV